MALKDNITKPNFDPSNCVYTIVDYVNSDIENSLLYGLEDSKNSELIGFCKMCGNSLKTKENYIVALLRGIRYDDIIFVCKKCIEEDSEI